MIENANPLVALVGAGPGNPGLLTLRAVECLARADLVLYDKLVPARLLDFAPPAAERVCIADLAGCHPERWPHIHQALMEVYRRRQARSPKDLRPWLVEQLVEAIDRSGLVRDAYLEVVHTRDAKALAALDEAFARIAERTAREEAWLRALQASGQDVAAFAEMYGLPKAEVERAVQRAKQRTQPV